MTLRHLLELLILFGTAATLIPWYRKKRKELEDLDGFAIVEENTDPEAETDIFLEEEA